MKVIANIPEDMLQELKDGCFGVKHTLYDLAGAICNGIVLPDNATNGDVMMAIFKDIQYYSDGHIDAGWWNEPYKKYKKENVK